MLHERAGESAVKHSDPLLMTNEFIDRRICGVLYFAGPGRSVLVMDRCLEENFGRFSSGNSHGAAVVPVENVTGLITSPGGLEEILDSNGADMLIILVSTRIPLLVLKKFLGRGNLRYIASYAVIPGFGNPRWFFPTEVKVLKRRWNIIKTGSLRSLLTFRLLQFFALAGYPQLIFHYRIVIAGRKGRRIAASGILKEFISQRLGRKDIDCILYTGIYSFYQKFTVLVMDKNSEIIAYARIGHTEQVRERINNEVKALNYLATLNFSTIRFPRVVSFDKLGCTSDIIVIQTPSPDGYKKLSKRLTTAHVASLIELFRKTTRNVHGKFLIEGLEKDFDKVRKNVSWNKVEILSALEGTLQILRKKLESTVVTLGFSHGDFIPWNLYLGGSGLFAFDWEVAKHRVPLWDLYYFILYNEILESSRNYKTVLNLLTDRNNAYAEYISRYQRSFEDSMFFDRNVFLAVTLYEIIIFYADYCYKTDEKLITACLSILKEIQRKL